MAHYQDWLHGPDRLASGSFMLMALSRNWTVTAYERRDPVTGHWSVEGKTLTLSFGGNDRSNPFTFYQGKLIFPNIPNRRRDWEKIE